MLLVDLERHAPVAVLQDSSADSFAALLTQHPSVRLMTRDRAGTYADGEASGAPHAIQIADRWHLLRNVGAALEKVLARHHDTIKRAFSRQHERHEQEHTPVAATPVVISHAERIHQSRRDRCFARYQEVRKLTPYLSYLQQHWGAGDHNAARLYRVIKATCGFEGLKRRCGSRSVPSSRRARFSHPESAGEAFGGEAAPEGHRPRGASRSEHGVSAGTSMRPGGPHQECQSLRTLTRASDRQRDTRVGQFCRRDQTRPVCCLCRLCRPHLSLESRASGRADSSPEAVEAAILWTSGF
jgi:Transposase